jgi:hypothetical protein
MKTIKTLIAVSKEDAFVILCHVGAAVFGLLFLTLVGLVLRFAL